MDTNNLLNSKQYYDSIAEEYAFIKKQKRSYLDKVDSIIINDFFQRSKKVLDVGAGDGLRGVKIFKQIEAKTICLVEESGEMIKNIGSLEGVEVFVGSIRNFPCQQDFDLILCLWNVLGHINNFQERVQILTLMKNCLSKNGVIAIDFNNRFNYKNYGVMNVIRNIIMSFFGKETGWFELKNHNNDIISRVYIHNYFEIKKIISQSGLRVKDLKVINYDDGTIHDNIFQGQYLFYLKK